MFLTSIVENLMLRYKYNLFVDFKALPYLTQFTYRIAWLWTAVLTLVLQCDNENSVNRVINSAEDATSFNV